MMEKYPEHVMLGEEGISWGGDLAAIEARKDKEWMWVVDPVDGTTNFVSAWQICLDWHRFTACPVL